MKHQKTNSAWRDLRAHRAAHKNISPMRLCAEDPRRFARLSLSLDDLLLDFSKTTLSAETVALLIRAAEEAGVESLRDAMFAGEIVNRSENRAALHIALRADAKTRIVSGGENVMPKVAAARAEMLDFADDCRKGRIAAADGAPFSDVVNIGIGGSDLGPATAYAALHPYRGGGARIHFVSNMDGAHLADTLAPLDARKTLIVASSKTFTTAETMENAKRAREWLAAAVGARAAKKHFAAVTASPRRAREFGAGRIFSYPQWVGGRYSVWGAVGLPLALAVGKKHFTDFLSGARDMDAHFISAPPPKNLPMMLALIGVWHRNFCGMPTRAVLPYDFRLRLLPAYLQQLDMESNGKHITQNGGAAKTATAPLVWGSPGTDAQHAYFQFLHQGSDITPCEFIVAARGHEQDDTQHRLLFANCLAQSAALMRGDSSPGLPPHRRFAGGRPSITILQKKLTPYTLGRLLALFEHRTFVEGAMWGINSFDQWGVELGKTLATRLHKTIVSQKRAADEDVSTRGLLRHYRRLAADN
ncbi:MAG: glucose-6-phosphate isomerase [Gammaproteobacteria bacterium]